MKSKEEILKRAIVLLAFSDRCAIEKKTVDGVKRADCQVSATHSLKNSAGVFQPRHFLGRLLMRSSTF